MATKFEPGTLVCVKADKGKAKGTIYTVASVGVQGRGYRHTLKERRGMFAGVKLERAAKGE